MAIDENTYGFEKQDAQALLRHIGGGDEEYPEGRVRGGSGTQDRLFKTPGGGIPAATGTGPYTFGSAACTPVNADGTVGSGTVTIKNIVNVAIAASVVIKAAKVGDIWVVDVASCGS